MSKRDLLQVGWQRVRTFCQANDLEIPELRAIARDAWQFGVCAYYRPCYVAICLEKCAAPGYAGRAWSWPGYAVDRTPYGVVAHELGHHVDWTRSNKRGAYGGDFSKELRSVSGEIGLTAYCPNDWEWFAEHFRLFVTNPDLLKAMRPATFARLVATGLKTVESRSWREVLADAPERTIRAAEGRITREARVVQGRLL